MIHYYNPRQKNICYEFGQNLDALLSKNSEDRTIIILCIGSDRSTGDSLGPLIGYKLSQYCIPGVCIYGTLSNPIHALNLQETLDEIWNLYVDPFIIAIDAALGSSDHVGCITLGTGPLKPGLGVDKKLPAAGHIHITGIVNYCGMLDQLMLQSTRLSLVMELADTITQGLLHCLDSHSFAC